MTDILSNLRVEYLPTPIGMDDPAPRFSFETAHARQDAYRITVTGENDRVVWDSGVVKGQSTCHIEYQGEPLAPFTRYRWTALSLDGDGKALCGDSWFETGFMGSPWEAPWLRGSQIILSSYIQVFRTILDCGDVAKAMLYITAGGVFEATINGKAVAEDLLPPGWTQYDKALQYRAYDVTTLLSAGQNRLEIHLANGWFTGRISTLWSCHAPTWGTTTILRAQLRLTYGDGAISTLPLNSSNTSFCQLMDQADIYDGTQVDRQNSLVMDSPENWTAATELDDSSLPFKPTIIWSRSMPVAHILDMAPVAITRRPNGAYIVDFGQNLVGREQFTLKNAPQGTMIAIRHGEMLRKDGSLYYENLRSAKAQTIYVSGTDATECFEPRFTFFGFRYLEITGWPGELTAEDIRARVIHTNLTPTGQFSSSEPMLNQLHSNILWGQRGNFIEVPTDCPQRDERLGWTADTQVFMDEATWNMDAAPFYAKWLTDLYAAQSPAGGLPDIVPHASLFMNHYRQQGATGWGDAGITCPFIMLEKYADIRLVKQYLPAMDRWLDYQIEQSNGSFILDIATYGDWLYIGIDDKDASPNFTPHDYISSAYLAGMLQLEARMHRLAGNDDAAKRRTCQYQQARAAFQRRFLDAEGHPVVRSQTGLLMALKWGLFEKQAADEAALLLVANIREENHTHLTTGFLGTPLLLDVLTAIGQVDLAYDLLLQTTYPGWLYPITQGATTMWERWNSYSTENGFGDASMNSFNHYAYGAVGAWFYRTICGIQPMSDTPEQLGFATFRLAPHFGRRLAAAQASYHSIHGLIASKWTRRSDQSILWTYHIPPNTTAQVITPDGQTAIEPPGTRTRIIPPPPREDNKSN